MTYAETDTTYTVTDAQKASFDRDGFLLLDDVLTTSQVTDLQSWTAEVKAWPNRQGEHMPYEEIRSDGTTGLCRTESKSSHLLIDEADVRLCQLSLWLWGIVSGREVDWDLD